VTNKARKTIATLQAYRAAFSSPAGKDVLADIIQNNVLADPIAEDVEATMVNLGMRRLAVAILRKVYRSEAALRAAITHSLEQEQENP
jgi:hypothetical protein